MTRQSSFESALAWMWRKLSSGHCQSASDFLIQLPRSINICKQFRAKGFEYKSLSISNTSHPLICKALFSKLLSIWSQESHVSFGMLVQVQQWGTSMTSKAVMDFPSPENWKVSQEEGISLDTNQIKKLALGFTFPP